MAKEDIQWAVLGILILLVVALVLKPMATGEPPKIGLPTPAPTATLPAINPTISQTPLPTPVETTSPKVTSTPPSFQQWNGTPQKVEFVDPSTYNVNLSEYIPRVNPQITPIPDKWNTSDIRTTKYISLLSKPISEKNSSTTGVIEIPVPYWEIWYSYETVSSDLQKQSEPSGKYIITPTQGKGASMSGFQGSYSTVMPEFKIIVMDYNDPNRIVRTIDAGAIDPKYLDAGAGGWTKDANNTYSIFLGKGREKFYEGPGRYYLIIISKVLKSYTVEITTPVKYDPRF